MNDDGEVFVCVCVGQTFFFYFRHNSFPIYICYDLYRRVVEEAEAETGWNPALDCDAVSSSSAK